MKFSRAFTMIELIFVIVILGILATVALPKFGKTREAADVGNARATIATIRAAIVNERQTRLILGDSDYIGKLSSSATTLFTGDTSTNPNRILLTYGITAGTAVNGWVNGATTATVDTYTFTAAGQTVTFDYTVATGVFTCDTTAGTAAQQALCKKLVN